MAGLDLTGTLKTLQGERSRMLQEVTKLDKAISVIQELAGATGATGAAGAEVSPNGHPKKRTMSAAGRRRIAKAQKLRWAKIREQKKAKA